MIIFENVRRICGKILGILGVKFVEILGNFIEILIRINLIKFWMKNMLKKILRSE